MQQKKLNIIKAAEKRFSRHGVTKSTLDELARDLRMGKATLYYYFESKEALYYGVLENQISEFINAIKQIFADESLSHEEKTAAYLKEKTGFPTRYSLLFALFENAFRDFPVEKEVGIIKKLIEKEESVLTKYFESYLKEKKDKTEIPALLKAVPKFAYTLGLLNILETKLFGEEKSISAEQVINLIQEKFLIK